MSALNGSAPLSREEAGEILLSIRELPEVQDALGQHLARQEAQERYRELRQLTEAPERVKQTLAEALLQPPVEAVLDRVLAAEVNLLGGREESGKSLLARDWAIAVASGQPWRGHRVREARNCLWIASEGTHDLTLRWEGQPHLEAARDRIFTLDPINLVAGSDVDWLLEEYRDERPGLVVFDLIYGMGMADDNGTRDVFPVLNNLKRISMEWGAATLAVGHPGHNGEKRLRGSSAWRQWAAVDWQMKDGVLSCEKSKIARKQDLRWSYRAEYPHLRWPNTGQVFQEGAERMQIYLDDVKRHPQDSDNARAERLAGSWSVTRDHARKLIRAMKTVGA